MEDIGPLVDHQDARLNSRFGYEHKRRKETKSVFITLDLQDLQEPMCFNETKSEPLRALINRS